MMIVIITFYNSYYKMLSLLKMSNSMYIEVTERISFILIKTYYV